MPEVMVRMMTRGGPRLVAVDRLNWMKKERPGWSVEWHFNKYCIATARCEVVEEARRGNASFLLMMDDDVDAGPNVLNLPELDLPVVSGAVLTFQNGCLFWNAYGLTPKGIFYSLPTMLPKVFEVYAAGTGVMCLSKEILYRRDLDPLFEFDANPDGTLRPLGGEDVTFCRKAQAQGIPIHVDGRCQGEHQTICDTLRWLNQTRRAGKDQSVPSTMVVNIRKIGVDCPSESYHLRLNDQASDLERKAMETFEEAAFAV